MGAPTEPLTRPYMDIYITAEHRERGTTRMLEDAIAVLTAHYRGAIAKWPTYTIRITLNAEPPSPESFADRLRACGGL